MSLYYSGSRITRVPLDVLSTELSTAFSPPNQYFVYNFYRGVNFCRKKIAVQYYISYSDAQPLFIFSPGFLPNTQNKMHAAKNLNKY